MSTIDIDFNQEQKEYIVDKTKEIDALCKKIILETISLYQKKHPVELLPIIQNILCISYGLNIGQLMSAIDNKKVTIDEKIKEIELMLGHVKQIVISEL